MDTAPQATATPVHSGGTAVPSLLAEVYGTGLVLGLLAALVAVMTLLAGAL
jgi:hypothetical protein